MEEEFFGGEEKGGERLWSVCVGSLGCLGYRGVVVKRREDSRDFII